MAVNKDFFYMTFINVTPTSDFTYLYHAPMFLISLYSKTTPVVPYDSNVQNKYISNMTFPYLLGFSRMLLGQNV